MPRLSEFYGIVIAMYYSDHNPPHFHAIYGEFRATIAIKNMALIEGKLPPKALALIVEWASQHQEELEHNWNLAMQHKELIKIDPLK